MVGYLRRDRHKTDVSRFGAQVINGIGFLGAGTILVTGRQQVKGLTTAAGLWASACTGLAVGAGFYECVLIAFAMIFLSIRLFPIVDAYIQENARDINLYMEFYSLGDISTIINQLKSQNVQIYDIDIERKQKWRGAAPKCDLLDPPQMKKTTAHAASLRSGGVGLLLRDRRAVRSGLLCYLFLTACAT